MTQKLLKLKKPYCNDHDKYITTPEFNYLAAKVVTARLAQANLITKIISISKSTQTKQNVYSLKKKNWKYYKHLIQFMLVGKVLLKKMAHKILANVKIF